MTDKAANVSLRRILALYITGIVIGFAGGFVTALMLWGLSFVH